MWFKLCREVGCGKTNLKFTHFMQNTFLDLNILRSKTNDKNAIRTSEPLKEPKYNRSLLNKFCEISGRPQIDCNSVVSGDSSELVFFSTGVISNSNCPMKFSEFISTESESRFWNIWVFSRTRLQILVGVKLSRVPVAGFLGVCPKISQTVIKTDFTKFCAEKNVLKVIKICKFLKVSNFTPQICRARPTSPPYVLNIRKNRFVQSVEPGKYVWEQIPPKQKLRSSVIWQEKNMNVFTKTGPSS